MVAECARVGRTIHIPHFIDTLTLSRRAFAARSYSLSSLCEQLGISRGVAHRAAADVTAMRFLFQKCVETLAPKSLRDLWEVRISEHRARADILAACEEAVKLGNPVEVVYRPSRKSPETLLMMMTEMRTSFAPPHVIGYVLPSRGRRELRADRILQVKLQVNQLEHDEIRSS